MAQGQDRRVEAVKAFFAILIILYLFTSIWSFLSQPRIPQAESKTAPKADLAFIEDLRQKWVDDLIKYECWKILPDGTLGCPNNYKRLDDNDAYSYGCHQYQWNTFRNLVKKYKLLPHAEEHEYMNMIYDCEFQKVVTRVAIDNESKAVIKGMWWTTIVKRGYGLPPEKHDLARY